jgi:MFS family permease
MRPTLAIGSFFFINGAAYASWVPRLGDIKESLGISDTQLGVTLVGGAVGSLAVNFVFVRIVERLGSRTATQVASIGLTLVLPFVGFAPRPAALFVALAAMGMLDVLADVSANTQAMQLQEGQARSILSRMHGTWSVGALAGGLAAGQADAAGVSVPTQLVVTSLALLTLATVARRSLLASSKVAASQSHTPLLVAGTRRTATVLVVAGAMGLMAELPPTEWSTLMIAERFPEASVGAAVGFIGFAIGMIVGRFVGDSVAERLGTTRTRRAGAGLAVGGFAVACTVPSLAITVLALCVAALGCSWLNPLIVQRAIEVFDGPRGATLVGTGARLGILVGSPVMGAISDQFNRSVALLLVGGTAAAVLLVLPLPHDTARSNSPAHR